jgi:hypothetical protein
MRANAVDPDRDPAAPPDARPGRFLVMLSKVQDQQSRLV